MKQTPQTLTEALATWRGAVVGAICVLVAAAIGAVAAIGGTILTARLEERGDIRTERQILYADFLDKANRLYDALNPNVPFLHKDEPAPPPSVIPHDTMRRHLDAFTDVQLTVERIELLGELNIAKKARDIENNLLAGVGYLRSGHCATDNRDEYICPVGWVTAEPWLFANTQNNIWAFRDAARKELGID